MKRSSFSLMLAAAVLVAAPSARATLIFIHVDLRPTNEVPPTASNGTGFGRSTLTRWLKRWRGISCSPA